MCTDWLDRAKRELFYIYAKIAYRNLSLTEIAPPRTGWVKAGLGTAAIKAAFAASVTTGVLGAGQAQAEVVPVDIGQGAGPQQWNVTTFTGSYNANTSKFNTAANGGMMPLYNGSMIRLHFCGELAPDTHNYSAELQSNISRF